MSKKPSPQAKPKADIDFEKELWDAANELRGAVAENQYKDYVLSLLFVKHLSERYEIRRQELQLSFFVPGSDYYNIDAQMQSEVLEDELEYQAKNVYRLPREATWEYLRERAEQDDIKVKVDQAFVLLDEILARRNPDYKGVLEPIFVRSQLSPTQVAGLINLFSKEKFSEINNPESDIYGRVYEYYIGKFAQAEGSGAGQFFTPGSVVRLLVEMIEPLRGRIMDLACGSGGMFVQSLKFVQAHGGDRNDISIYGQERYEGTLRLCKMNLLLRNLSFDVKLGDSLLQDRFPQLKADYALMNPPFNISNWHPELLPENDPRLFGAKEEFTTPGNANYMWFQTLWHHLSERGTAGVVMANGAMTTGSAGERNVREHMIRRGMVDCIVQMPDKLFLTTGIPACLFILSRNRDGKDGEHRERRGEILFIDARKLGHMVSRRLRVFEDKDLERIADTYHQWRNLGGTYADVEGFCKAASLAEVEANGFVLSPGRYVGSEAEEGDGVPFEEKMKALTEELAKQFEEGAALEVRIKANLDSLGF
ncbi:type I restriction-modification system subunit M [Cesiribacter andamanensis]|uniref:site-specific DNA-methyltransferase (adenine-specific) n=1 Tax=Cesiribacter andamanensis AMV16 TaxID=1279009 RepID=M7N0I9_9BACT|nr:class I SAM-dependent DNA methyltransferase [Cesiribacter andamanensis]EMR00802.1 Type I restriction enzyme EcoKI M protein [Cesiribacter andamanensis AMV16]